MNDSEDLMICDLAQYYHILDYTQIKPNILASLVIGLPDDSRVMRKISGSKLGYKDSVLALIFDALQIIAYNQGHKRGAAKPESFYKKLTTEEVKEEYEEFSSPEQYEAWRKEHICQTPSQPHMSR